MVQEILNSMVRFSTASAMFTQQQMQAMLGMAMQGEPGMKAMVEALDSATKVLSHTVDPKQKGTMKSMTDMGSDFVNSAFDTMKLSRMDPQHMMDTTGNIVRQVSYIFDNAIKKTAEVAKAAAGEPQPAADAHKA